MKDKELAIAAIKEEAKQKPDEKVVVGKIVLSYGELLKKAEDGDKFVEDFLIKPYMKLLKESKDFRNKVMVMLGVKE